MKITRIQHCTTLHKSKYQQLEEQAVLLGDVRSEVWRRYGALAGLTLGDRKIRDTWIKEGRTFRMRKHFRHGINHTHNQIVVRADMCKTFGWDNEYGQHREDLSSFKASKYLVSKSGVYTHDGLSRALLPHFEEVQ